MRSGDNLPKIKQIVLAGLAKGPVRLACVRTKKLARELRKELRMCDVKVVQEDYIRGYRHFQGELLVTWKRVL